MATNTHNEHVNTAGSDSVPRVAIIGAGISGLSAARTLTDRGMSVTVFEKSRGIGGRMSTRRLDDGVSFDHGAQYFTARDPQFKQHVESWVEQGVVAAWPDQNLTPAQKIVVLGKGVLQSESNSQYRYVAVPAMNAICKHLAQNLDVKTKTRIGKIVQTSDGIELFDESGQSTGLYDRLIVSAPAAQTVELLGGFSTLVIQISSVKMNPCWAAMVSFPEAVTEEWVGAFLHDSFLSWVARNNTKPGRKNNADHLVIHANPEWTEKHWDDGAYVVANAMLQEFWLATGLQPQTHTHLQAHRWKYAIPVDPPDVRCFVDDSGFLVACGDWASGSRVEGGFMSGIAAASKILDTLNLK